MGDPFFLIFMLDRLFPSADWGNLDELRSDLWSKLPHDLVTKVLLRLPSASQARFQAAARHGSTFFRLGSSRRSRRLSLFSSGLYICGFAHVHVNSYTREDLYDLERLDVHYKVHKLSLAALPQQPEEAPVQDCYTGRRFLFCAGDVEVTTVGFSDRSCRHGLILLKYVRECQQSFGKADRCLSVNIVVLNPLNNTWRQLPTLYTPPNALPQVELTDDGEDFKVSVGYQTYSETYLHTPDMTVTGEFTFVYSTLANEWMSNTSAQDSSWLCLTTALYMWSEVRRF